MEVAEASRCRDRSSVVGKSSVVDKSRQLFLVPHFSSQSKKKSGTKADIHYSVD
jgi:hypothetical protein